MPRYSGIPKYIPVIEATKILVSGMCDEQTKNGQKFGCSNVRLVRVIRIVTEIFVIYNLA